MRRFIFLAVALAILILPHTAGAVAPIVPCGGTGQLPCTPCDLFQGFKNLIDLVLYGITGPIAAFMIVWAGGMMLLGGGKRSLFADGRKILQNTLIGVTIILLAWLVTNTLIKSLVTGNQADKWYEFSCPAFLQLKEQPLQPTPGPDTYVPGVPAPALIAASTATCKEENLAAANKVPVHQRSEYKAPPNLNQGLQSASLNALISCLLRDPVVKAMYSPSNTFTYDVDHPLCNLTHGTPACGGGCSHGEGSCHYGGRTGTQGAMGVDFNSNGLQVTYLKATRTVITGPIKGSECEKDVNLCRTAGKGTGFFDELYRAAVKNNCSYKMMNFEPTRGGHTHISTNDCTSDAAGTFTFDGKSTFGRAPPVLP